MADDTQGPGYSGEERVFTAGGEHYGIMYDVYRYVSLTLVSAGGAIYDLTQQVAQVSGVANGAAVAAATAQQTANQGVAAAAAAQQTANNAYALQTTVRAANTVYAGPAAGAATPAAWRALVVADLPVVDIAHGGTGASDAATARGNLAAAASGANSDITSITGLTTALTVAQGGTGVKTLANYGVLIGNGANPVGAITPGVAGTVLMSSGTGSYASWQAIPSQTGRLIGPPRVITSTSVYTKTPGTNFVIFEVVPPGGGGGGAISSTAAGGGGSGPYARVLYSSGFDGVMITIGAPGIGGTGSVNGGTGGTTSVGGLISGSGGLGGAYGTTSAQVQGAIGGIGGAIPTISGGTVLEASAGAPGLPGLLLNNGAFGGNGGNSRLGAGGGITGAGTGSAGYPGQAGSGAGAGGAGASSGNSGGNQKGGDGAVSKVIAWEFS